MASGSGESKLAVAIELHVTNEGFGRQSCAFLASLVGFLSANAKAIVPALCCHP